MNGNNQFNPYTPDGYHNAPAQYDNNPVNNFSNLSLNSAPVYQHDNNMYNTFSPHMPPNISSSAYSQGASAQSQFSPQNAVPNQPPVYQGSNNFYPNAQFQQQQQPNKDMPPIGGHSTNKDAHANANAGLYGYQSPSASSYSASQSQMPPSSYPPGQATQSNYPPGQAPQSGYPPSHTAQSNYPPGQTTQSNYPPGQAPQAMPFQSGGGATSPMQAPMGHRYANNAPQSQSLNPEFMPSAVQVTIIVAGSFIG